MQGLTTLQRCLKVAAEKNNLKQMQTLALAVADAVAKMSELTVVATEGHHRYRTQREARTTPTITVCLLLLFSDTQILSSSPSLSAFAVAGESEKCPSS